MIRNKINSGSFGDVYKLECENPKENKKESFAVKVIKNSSYGIHCLAEIFILLFLQYSYLANSKKFCIDLKSRVTKILLPLASCDFRAKLVKDFSVKIPCFSRLKNIAWQLTCAVAFLHSKGVIHGDIKPSNLLMYKNEVRLSDFSLSSLHLSENDRNYAPTAFSEHYRAPEIWEKKGYSYKADIWALGCTFHEIFYQKKYVKSGTFYIDTEQDKQLQNIFLAMLEVDEEKRYTIWNVIESDFFRDIREKQPFSFSLSYPKDQIIEDDLVVRLKNLVSPFETDIPDYVYEIVIKKLLRKTIEKSYLLFLDETFLNQEAKIVEILWDKNIGSQIF